MALSVSGQSRQVIVDDTDPSILYSGGNWFTDIGSLDNFGTSGTPYQRTLHGTTSNGRITTTFNGTLVDVRGTYDSDAPGPTWTCTIDGSAIESQAPVISNNNQFCFVNNLPDGAHTLTIDVRVPGNRTFWFDWFSYQPSQDASIDNAVVVVDNEDPDIQYNPPWTPSSFDVAPRSRFTFTEGAAANVSFIGTSVSWYGYFSGNSSNGLCTGNYSIDNAHMTHFTVDTGENEQRGNVLVFATPQLPYGHHNLLVTYTGSRRLAPLVLDYLLIRNGSPTDSLAGTSESSLPVPTSESSAGPVTRQRSNVGAIAGGVAGGVVALALIALSLLFWRRRHRQQKVKEAMNEDGPRFVYDPFAAAVAIPPSVPYLAPASQNTQHLRHSKYETDTSVSVAAESSAHGSSSAAHRPHDDVDLLPPEYTPD